MCFVPSHVKAYARYLGLDPALIFQRFCQEAGCVHWLESPQPLGEDSRVPALPLGSKPSPVFPVTQTQITGMASIGFLVLFIGLIAYLGNAAYTEIQRVTLLESGSDAAATESFGEYRNKSVQPGSDPNATGIESAPQVSSFGTSEQNAGRLPKFGNSAATDLLPIGEIAPQDVGSYAPREAHLSDQHTPLDIIAGVNPLATSRIAEPEMELVAAGEVWAQVSDTDGRILLRGLLQASHVWAVPVGQGRLTLRAGNSDRLFFRINGDLFGPASSEPGAVVMLSLDAASLVETLSLADPDAVLAAAPLAPGSYTVDAGRP